MYTSQFFSVSDVPRVTQFIMAHSFGTVVSDTGRILLATHVPLLLGGAAQPGSTLSGHMARQNPQASCTDEGAEVLTIFNGPNSYVSPTAYVDEPDVPTWNYQAAHVYGRWRLLHEPEQIESHLHEMVARHESAGWDLSRLDPARVAALARGITAFQVTITRVECAFKLSQDKSERDRRGVIEWLESAACAERGKLAQAMRAFYNEQAGEDSVWP